MTEPGELFCTQLCDKLKDLIPCIIASFPPSHPLLLDSNTMYLSSLLLSTCKTALCVLEPCTDTEEVCCTIRRVNDLMVKDLALRIQASEKKRAAQTAIQTSQSRRDERTSQTTSSTNTFANQVTSSNDSFLPRKIKNSSPKILETVFGVKSSTTPKTLVNHTQTRRKQKSKNVRRDVPGIMNARDEQNLRLDEIVNSTKDVGIQCAPAVTHQATNTSVNMVKISDVNRKLKILLQPVEKNTRLLLKELPFYQCSDGRNKRNRSSQTRARNRIAYLLRKILLQECDYDINHDQSNQRIE